MIEINSIELVYALKFKTFAFKNDRFDSFETINQLDF
jgi:hypothetical protein